MAAVQAHETKAANTSCNAGVRKDMDLPPKAKRNHTGVRCVMLLF